MQQYIIRYDRSCSTLGILPHLSLPSSVAAACFPGLCFVPADSPAVWGRGNYYCTVLCPSMYSTYLLTTQILTVAILDRRSHLRDSLPPSHYCTLSRPRDLEWVTHARCVFPNAKPSSLLFRRAMWTAPPTRPHTKSTLTTVTDYLLPTATIGRSHETQIA